MTERTGLELRLRQSGPIPLDIELTCRSGETVALVGPSGSGKTTVLRAIAGLYSVREARMSCDGEVWDDTRLGVRQSPQRRRIGLVFQDYALFPHLSALGNVRLALSHLPRAVRPARARELLARVHLQGLEARRPEALSGGQRQRVAVARALAREPRALLLDEPFSAVDQVTRGKLQRELSVMRRDLAIPLLLVTHDLAEASALADRLYVIHRGCILQEGPPERVLNRPAAATVARILGQTNIFSGRVSGPARLHWQGGDLTVRSEGELEEGAPVSWVVSPAYIVMHRRDRPSRGERENPVSGTVGELVRLGEQTHVTLWVDGRSELPLNFAVSTHAARRNGLAAGVSATVSLLAEGIHLMPPERRP